MAFYQLVHHDKKFIALFSPKCACTTLKWWFAASLEPQRIEDEQELNVHRLSVPAIADYPHYWKLFFVRSPYDRLVSFYASFIVDYVELWGFADADKKVGLEGKTFSQFVRILDELVREGTRLQHHLEPQLHGLDSVAVDRVVRVDDLDRELPEISRELGFDYTPEHRNANRYQGDITEPVADRRPAWFRSRGLPHYRHFYTDELREIVANLYLEDLACYGLAPWRNPKVNPHDLRSDA